MDQLRNSQGAEMKSALVLAGLVAALVLIEKGYAAVLIIAVLVVGWLFRPRSTRTTYPITHPSGRSDRHVRRHEEGHANVARALGCKVNVDLDKGQTTILSGPALTPAQHAAIAYGGQARAGRGGQGEDNRIAERHLSRLPANQRGAARREAKRIARRHA